MAAAKAQAKRSTKKADRFAPGTHAIGVNATQNLKLGNAATTYVEQRSCPDGCVFRNGGGCYAEHGRVGMITARLNRAAAANPDATPEDIARDEAAEIDGFNVARNRPLRLHTVGDCKTDEAAAIVAAAADRYRARGGGPVWTYTHAWRDVERESWAEVNVLASCETAADVDAAHARGYATAIVVKEFESTGLPARRRQHPPLPAADRRPKGREGNHLLELPAVYGRAAALRAAPDHRL
jgi:hypothetical protein